MKQNIYDFLNTVHAWICLQVFNTPLPYLMPKKYKSKIKLAKVRLLSIRQEKITQVLPKPHVIHIFKPEGISKGKILVTHGWMSQSVYMMGIIDALFRAGYTVYAIDFPAHGESKGLSVKWFESVQAIHETQKKFGPFDAAIGHSYGGSMLLCAFCLSDAYHVKPFKNIALLAAPTTITLPIKTVARRLKLNRGAYRLFRQWMRSEHNIDVKRLKPYYKAKAGDTKFLVIHGENDSIVPPKQAIQFCKSNPNARLCLEPNMGHINIIFSDKTYQDILSFIDHTDK